MQRIVEQVLVFCIAEFCAEIGTGRIMWRLQLHRFWKSSMQKVSRPSRSSWTTVRTCTPKSCSQVAPPCSQVWREHAEGVHFVGTVHDENQGDGSTRAQIVDESLWICLVFPQCWSRSTRAGSSKKHVSDELKTIGLNEPTGLFSIICFCLSVCPRSKESQDSMIFLCCSAHPKLN